MVKIKVNDGVTYCEMVNPVVMHDAIEIAHCIKRTTTERVVIDTTAVMTIDSAIVGAILKHRNERKVIIKVCDGSYIHKTLKMMQIERFLELEVSNDPACKKSSDDE